MEESGEKMIETLNDLVAFWALLIVFFGTVFIFIFVSFMRTSKVRKAKIEAAKKEEENFNDDWL